MQQENSQMQELTAEEAKASLGVATFLQDQLLPQGEETAETSQDLPDTEVDIEAKISSVVDEKLNKFKQELLSDLEDETDKDTKINTEA